MSAGEISPAQALAAVVVTWPPASERDCGPFRLREGQGGGSRVSAAVAQGDAGVEDIVRAEAGMRDLRQIPLFQITPADRALDDLLAARGYQILDPVVILAAPVAAFPPAPTDAKTFCLWPPLAVQRDLWAAGGIGPARQAVMERVTTAKTSLLGRLGEDPAAVAFVACDGEIAMLHALEVAPEARRHGLGRQMMAEAARWAARQGATHLGLAVTRANSPANALYSSLGMQPVAEYHYRVLPG